MDLSKPFINEYGRLRSGWRVVVFLAASAGLYLFFGIGLWLIYSIGLVLKITIPHAGYLADFTYRVLLLASALGAGYFCCRVIEGLPWRSLGLNLHRSWSWDFFIGSVVGILSLSLAVLIATSGGGLRFALPDSASILPVLKSLVTSGMLFLIAALAEEAMFRGYPLQTLSRANLVLLAVLLTSIPFAAVHLWNPNVVRGVTFANTAVAGVWLAIAYLRTRSLWLPFGVHWAWNWALGSLFGLPVSGGKLASHPLLNATDFGPTWLTGGNYGIEGGVACTVALILSSIFLWRTNLVSASPEQFQLTAQENPVINRPIEEPPLPTILTT